MDQSTSGEVSCGACPAKSGSLFAYPMSDKSVAPEVVDRLVVGPRDLVEVVLGEDEGSSDLSVCQSPLLLTWMLSDLFPHVVWLGVAARAQWHCGHEWPAGQMPPRLHLCP